MMIQGDFTDVSEKYKSFVDKFKPKKTTDDCYTPENIYNVVLEWAANKYGFDKAKAVRPFWPGGDYQRETYAPDCVVVDNPPFSILSEITKFYCRNGIRFFLFAPALTLFNSNSNSNSNNNICCGASVTYENGAVVNTSFLTNMGEYKVETAPDLRDLIEAANEENEKKIHKQLPKYSYPPEVITAAAMNYLSVHHTPFKLRKEDCVFIRRMDAQVGTDKALFGGGFLLSERAAAERAAAERAAAERAAATVWKLSPREREIQKLMAKESYGVESPHESRRKEEA